MVVGPVQIVAAAVYMLFVEQVFGVVAATDD